MAALSAFAYGVLLFGADAALIGWLVGKLLHGGSSGLFSAALFLKFFLLAGGLYLGLIGLDLDPIWLVVGALLALATIVAASLVRARRRRRPQESKNVYPGAQN